MNTSESREKASDEWRKPKGETFAMWDTETRDLPATLRQVADLLEANRDLVLYTIVNCPTEPADPCASVVQMTLSYSPDQDEP